MGTGSQSQHQDAGRIVTETGNRLAPVRLATIGAALDTANLLPVMDQTRTLSALNHLGAKDPQAFDTGQTWQRRLYHGYSRLYVVEGLNKWNLPHCRLCRCLLASVAVSAL